MSIEIKAPTFPESIADGTIVTWYKQPGEACERDELIVDIETDKVVLEVVAPADGSLVEIIEGEDATVLSEQVIATFAEGAVAAAPAAETAPAVEAAPEATTGGAAGPAARLAMAEKGVDAASVAGTGVGGRITKSDVEGAAAPQAAAPKAAAAPAVEIEAQGNRTEKRVPMTRMRKTIAKRLMETQQNAAMLTTFNEVNMKPVMELRKQYKDKFEKTHNGTRLGFMSFFVKAASEALKRFPEINASIDGDDVVYHGYNDISVAVSSPRGLVTPVLRNTENMSMAGVESTIMDYALKAKAGKLSIDDMQGGTFTITNGGIFGSLMSTPIINPPQTAILGMHSIKERPMAVNGKVEILPMMYLAVSYDHRLVDGKDAVQFLVAIKDLLEDPARILLEI